MDIFLVGNLQNIWSHFILGGLNYYVRISKNEYNVLIVLQNTIAAIEVGYG